MIVLALYDRLPESIVLHYGVNGEPDGWGPPYVLALLPMLLAVLHVVCHFVTRTDPRTQNCGPVMLGFLYWVVPVLSVLLTALCLCTSLGVTVPVPLVLQLLVGAVLIFAGNYMPKCKQNYFIGVKLPWTLNDAGNWAFTHRVTGFAWVVAGILALISAFLPVAWLLLVAILIAAIVPFAASAYYRYRK